MTSFFAPGNRARTAVPAIDCRNSQPPVCTPSNLGVSSSADSPVGILLQASSAHVSSLSASPSDVVAACAFAGASAPAFSSHPCRSVSRPLPSNEGIVAGVDAKPSVLR